MRRVKAKLPNNLAPKYKPFFISKQYYRIDDLSVKVHNNTFISYEGLCLKNLLLLKKSHFNIKGSKDKVFYFLFFKLVLEQYLVSTYGKSLTKVNLTNGRHLHIYTKWFGYFFWITDCLPKLIKTMHLHKDIKLIYPKSWDDILYVQDTLALFPNLQKEVIQVGTHMQVEKLILPETRQYSNVIDPNEIEVNRTFLFDIIDKKGIKTHFGEKIYISRKQASKRKPINENELEAYLQEKGFKSVCMENYSFLEQINIMRNAKYLIALHGAGMANLQFMKKNGFVLELGPEVINEKDLRIPFWRMSTAIDCDYNILFCEVDNSKKEDIYDCDLFVNMNELKKII